MFDPYGNHQYQQKKRPEQGFSQEPMKQAPDFRKMAQGAISPTAGPSGGTEMTPMAQPQQDAAPQGAGDILGGILGSIGKSLGGGGGQEEQYPEAPTWMPNQGVIGKQPFEAPRLPEMASGLGQAAIL